LRLPELIDALKAPTVTVKSIEPSLAEIGGLTAEQIGDAAAAHSIAVHELTPVQASLEEAFMELTQGAVQFHASTTQETEVTPA